MSEYPEQPAVDLTASVPQAAPVMSEAPEHTNGVGSRYAVAGRKGAERIHQLIERGRLYEHEHGLKRGRQRLRQLIEEGKLYEQEHGLGAPRRKARGVPASPEQVVRRLLDTLVRVAKPAYRAELLKLVQALDGKAA